MAQIAWIAERARCIGIIGTESKQNVISRMERLCGTFIVWLLAIFVGSDQFMDQHDRRAAEMHSADGIADMMHCNPWSFVKDDDRDRIKQWGGDAFELKRRATDRQD